MRGMRARDRIMTVICVVRGTCRRSSSGTLTIMMGLIMGLLWGADTVPEGQELYMRGTKGVSGSQSEKVAVT
jgi:hypothetical protein